MTYTKDALRQIFQQPFNQEGWQNMLRHYFHASELKAAPERIDNTLDDEKGYYLGAIDTTDNYRIGWQCRSQACRIAQPRQVVHQS